MKYSQCDKKKTNTARICERVLRDIEPKNRAEGKTIQYQSLDCQLNEKDLFEF